LSPLSHGYALPTSFGEKKEEDSRPGKRLTQACLSTTKAHMAARHTVSRGLTRPASDVFSAAGVIPQRRYRDEMEEVS